MGTRNTCQRVKILEYLKGSREHPTAEMVYEAVKRGLPNISLATVYRNLHLLADEHKINRLEISGEYHFDGHTEHHQHGVCTKCGKIIDIENDKISEYALKNAKSEEFQPECVHIIYHGICKEGRKK